MGRNGNFQIRQNPQCCDNWEHMMSNGQWMCGKTHGACSHNASSYGRKGGKLIGPSHESGGIPAIVGGHERIELEGGEYIMNAQTTKALGVEFLDKLNSTATTYHQGGFQRGQLPGPSMYRDGGKVPNRRNNMRRGGRPVRRTKPVARGRKMARGGALRSSARPMARRGGARPMVRRGGARPMARRGTSPMRGAVNRNVGRRPSRGPVSPMRKSYRTGGSVRGRNVRKFQHGGSLLHPRGFGQLNANPCPNDTFSDPDYRNFIEVPKTDGTHDYYCCKGNFRSDECRKWDKESLLADKIFFD